MPGSDKPGADQVTLVAAVALPRFRCVDVDGTGKAILSGGARWVGVTLAPASLGAGASILLPQGVGLIEAGAAIAAGASVGCDATGRAISGKAGVGVALEAAAASGQIISVLFGAAAIA